MLKSLEKQLYANTNDSLPREIVCGETTYRLSEVLKHDFFAATLVYESSNAADAAPAKVVLKMGRSQYFLGIPLLWIGEMLCSHEISILRHIGHLAGVPRFLSRYGTTGFLYEYIEGSSLDGQTNLPDDFFDELAKLLAQVHETGVAYLDMNKKGNIIVGRDAKPYMIDFQISLNLGSGNGFWGYLRGVLQRADIYHLFKHKRHLRPDLLTAEEQLLSRRKNSSIRLHRLLANPLRKLRRSFLAHLYKKGYIGSEIRSSCNPEDDPARFMK